MRTNRTFNALLIVVLVLAAGCSNSTAPQQSEEVFSIVMLPDTQNYVDYTRQQAAGFALDSSELYFEQMENIASRGRSNDGNVVFVASVGDVWQHATETVDLDHREKGFGRLNDGNPDVPWEVTEETLTFEIPTAVAGYRLLSQAEIPFGVAPGNHAYDAAWRETPQDVHVGGLVNFIDAFGQNSEFFQDQPWYISGFNQGTSSGQTFTGGGYRFLHLAFEMQPSDDVLAWAQTVIDENPGMPTIISTHDFLNPAGERAPNPRLDLTVTEPEEHNSAEQVWEKFIRRNDQVFMVLSGHQVGQAIRIDENDAGNQVYQILADFQGRRQVALEAGQDGGPNGGLATTGDGWYRIMEFDLTGAVPTVQVSTYSSHYRSFSSELDTYASWYKDLEQPEMTDSQFYVADEFKIVLSDFRDRFGSLSQ